MSDGARIALGALLGVALGIVVSVATDLPLAPEAGLVLGALAGWLTGRNARSPVDNGASELRERRDSNPRPPA